MNTILYAERVSRCVEGKYIGRFRDRDLKKIWEKRWRSSKSNKTQKRKTRGKNYERIYIEI